MRNPPTGWTEAGLCSFHMCLCGFSALTDGFQLFHWTEQAPMWTTQLYNEDSTKLCTFFGQFNTFFLSIERKDISYHLFIFYIKCCHNFVPLFTLNRELKSKVNTDKVSTFQIPNYPFLQIPVTKWQWKLHWAKCVCFKQLV